MMVKLSQFFRYYLLDLCIICINRISTISDDAFWKATPEKSWKAIPFISLTCVIGATMAIDDHCIMYSVFKTTCDGNEKPVKGCPALLPNKILTI